MNFAAVATRHWFYLLLPVWLAASWAFRSSHPWGAEPAFGEAITLIDWCIFVPATFALCYRSMTRRALALRVLALVCGRIWLAGKIVPPEAQTLLQNWGSIRWLGISILLLFEVVAFAAVLRVVFGTAPDPQVLEREGIPPLVAKIMIAEAKFWKWVWTRLTGR